MADVRSKRGYAASHLSDTYIVHQHQRKRNTEGTGGEGKYFVDQVFVISTFCFLMKRSSIPTFSLSF